MQWPLLLIIFTYLLANFYLFRQLKDILLLLTTPWRQIIICLYWCIALALFISIGLRDAALPSWLSHPLFFIGSSWLIVVLYMTPLTLLMQLIQQIFPRYRHGLIYAGLLTLGILTYGYIHHFHVEVYRYDIQIDKKMSPTPIKIVGVSDIHLGEGTTQDQLHDYIEKIQAEKPDLILISGDLIDHGVTALYRDAMAQQLHQLRAPLGIYMVPGNHEYLGGMEQCAAFISKTPIRLLRDEIATLPNGIQIIGRDDYSNKNRKELSSLLKQTNPAQPIILLDHQPRYLAENAKHPIDLQLSGHTHHGQIWPLNWLTDYLFEQSYGYKQWGQMHVFVSSGLSLWGPPFRIGTTSDMAVFTLQPKQ